MPKKKRVKRVAARPSKPQARKSASSGTVRKQTPSEKSRRQEKNSPPSSATKRPRKGKTKTEVLMAELKEELAREGMQTKPETGEGGQDTQEAETGQEQGRTQHHLKEAFMRRLGSVLHRGKTPADEVSDSVNEEQEKAEEAKEKEEEALEAAEEEAAEEVERSGDSGEDAEEQPDAGDEEETDQQQPAGPASRKAPSQVSLRSSWEAHRQDKQINDLSSQVTQLKAEIDKIKAQGEAASENRKATSERFLRMAEETGQLRSDILNLEKEIRDLTVRTAKAVELVESIKPEKFFSRLEKQNARIESFDAKIQGNKELSDRALKEIKDIRSRMAVFKGVEQNLKLNQEINEELRTLQKLKGLVETRANKVENLFIDMKKRFSRFEQFESIGKDVQQTAQSLLSEWEKKKTEENVTKEDLQKIQQESSETAEMAFNSINELKEDIAQLYEKAGGGGSSETQEEIRKRLEALEQQKPEQAEAQVDEETVRSLVAEELGKAKSQTGGPAEADGDHAAKAIAEKIQQIDLRFEEARASLEHENQRQIKEAYEGLRDEIERSMQESSERVAKAMRETAKVQDQVEKRFGKQDTALKRRLKEEEDRIRKHLEDLLDKRTEALLGSIKDQVGEAAQELQREVSEGRIAKLVKKESKALRGEMASEEKRRLNELFEKVDEHMLRAAGENQEKIDLLAEQIDLGQDQMAKYAEERLSEAVKQMNARQSKVEQRLAEQDKEKKRRLTEEGRQLQKQTEDLVDKKTEVLLQSIKDEVSAAAEGIREEINPDTIANAVRQESKRLKEELAAHDQKRGNDLSSYVEERLKGALEEVAARQDALESRIEGEEQTLLKKARQEQKTLREELESIIEGRTRELLDSMRTQVEEDLGAIRQEVSADRIAELVKDEARKHKTEGLDKKTQRELKDWIKERVAESERGQDGKIAELAQHIDQNHRDITYIMERRIKQELEEVASRQQKLEVWVEQRAHAQESLVDKRLQKEEAERKRRFREEEKRLQSRIEEDLDKKTETLLGSVKEYLKDSVDEIRKDIDKERRRTAASFGDQSEKLKRELEMRDRKKEKELQKELEKRLAETAKQADERIDAMAEQVDKNHGLVMKHSEEFKARDERIKKLLEEVSNNNKIDNYRVLLARIDTAEKKTDQMAGMVVKEMNLLKEKLSEMYSINIPRLSKAEYLSKVKKSRSAHPELLKRDVDAKKLRRLFGRR